MTTPRRVCLSYRTADVASDVERLTAALGPGFAVVRAPEPVERERDAVEGRLDGCVALLVAVGPQWSELAESAAGHPGPDPVVSLLDRATTDDLPVVVVLLGDVEPPAPGRAPDPWAPLRDRETVRIRAEAFDHDLAELARVLEHRLTPPPAAPEPALDENVQFTVYRPRAIRPDEWYDLLAFAHLAERRPDAPPDQPDPLAEVEAQAQRMLGQLSAYANPRADARFGVPQDGEITFLPEIAGVVFNPERRIFRWQEDVHREHFRLRAEPDLAGRTARGRMRVYLGMIILAEVDLAIRVDHGAPPAGAAEAPAPPAQARPYRKIFASYSHRDAEVVRQFELMARVLGDDYLRDVVRLRAGTEWDEALLRLIDEADVFQLFWSSHSMHSPFVRREWEYAESLGRTHFIRPTYWEEPLPNSADPPLPPDSLRRLHFSRLSTDPAPALTPASPATATWSAVATPANASPPGAPAAPPQPPRSAASPEPPKRRRRYALLAPLGAAVLGATALSGVLLGTGPRATSGDAVAPTSVATQRPSASAPEATPPADSQLQRRIPLAIADTCRPVTVARDSPYAKGLVAAVRCRPPGQAAPADVWYLQYVSRAAMAGAFATTTEGTDYADGPCRTAGQQFDYTTSEAPGQVAGGLRCYTAEDLSGLAWTHDRLSIVALAEDPDLPLPALLTWWRSAGPYLKPGPGVVSKPA